MTNPYGQPYGQPTQLGYPASDPVPVPYGAQQPYYQQQPYPAAYPQQPGYPQAPYAQQPAQDIPNYKGWAIGCIFLFWILAIFAIMKSNEVDSYKLQGNWFAAKQASDSTRTMCLIATIVGAIGWVIGIVAIIISIATASRYSPYY